LWRWSGLCRLQVPHRCIVGFDDILQRSNLLRQRKRFTCQCSLLQVRLTQRGGKCLVSVVIGQPDRLTSIICLLGCDGKYGKLFYGLPRLQIDYGLLLIEQHARSPASAKIRKVCHCVTRRPEEDEAHGQCCYQQTQRNQRGVAKETRPVVMM